MRRIGKSKIVAGVMAAIMMANVFYTTVPTYAVENDSGTGQESVVLAEDQNEASILECLLEVHSHDTDCYDKGDRDKLICGMADFVVHTHDENCYDSDGALACTLKEKKIHKHVDSCYKDAGTELVCGQEDASKHAHTDECYQTDRVLACGQEESTGHTHSDVCHEHQLICGQEESTGHTHSESCYFVSTESQLTCGQEEGEDHIHDDSCYTATEHRDLICGQEESAGHTHSDACYQDQLICGQEETEGHTHTENCYTEEKTLICSPHTHTDACRETRRTLKCDKEEIELHTHLPSCYDRNGALICEKLEVLEHQHTDKCFKTAAAKPAAEVETEIQTEPVTGAETEIQTEQATEANTEIQTENTTESEYETETATNIDETETETETELETETEVTLSFTVDSLEPEMIQSLSSAIVEAVKEDMNLWNYLMTAMYGEDEESIALLAEQFEVTPEIMQLYVQSLQETFSALYDAMAEDEDGSLWEALMNAQEDEAQLAELAERFGIDAGMLLLFIQYTMAAYEPELLADGTVTEGTPEYNMSILGQSRMAFSLNKTKTKTEGVSYTLYAKSTEITISDYLNICTNAWGSSWYDWQHKAVALCASYYFDSTWISKAKTTFNCSEEEAKTILRAAIQQAIWFWTDYPGHNYMDTNTTFQKFASDIKDAAYKAADYFPSSFPFNWYKPKDTTSSPYLLVYDPVSEGAGYVGFQGGKLYASNRWNTKVEANPQLALYVMPYEAYVSAQSAAERLANAQIAYCFDHNLHWPSNTASGNWKIGYDEAYLADRYQLYAETSDDASFKTDKNKIMAIALNGYPHNVSNFYTGQISEEAYRLVTQWAIWHYTDKDNLPDYYNADEAALYSKLINSDYTATMKNLGALIGSTDSATAQAYINVYKSMGQAYDSANGTYVTNKDSAYVGDKAFQNLLVVGYRSNAINLPAGTLTVSKTVTGAPSAQASTDFSFEAVFKKGSEAYTGTISVAVTRKNATAAVTETWTPDANGKVTFTLKGGENVKLTLPASVTYTVTEKDIPENFTQTSPAVTDANPSGSATGTIESAANVTVAFTNKYEEPQVPQTDGTLTVSKTVTGDIANMPDADFTFEAVFKQDNAAYTDTISAAVTRGTATAAVTETWTPDADGKVSFTLKAGENVVLTLPAGVTYTVTEKDIPEDFTLTSPQGVTEGTITAAGSTIGYVNNFSNETRIEVKKIWVGDEADTSGRGSSLTFELWKHVEGKEDALFTRSASSFNGTFQLTAAKGWKDQFSSLPIYENGEKITYYIKEVNVPDNYICTEDGLTVTNTYVPDLTLSKKVEGLMGDREKLFQFEISLKDTEGNPVSGSFKAELSGNVDVAANASIQSNADGAAITFANGSATVFLKHGQTIRIQGIPAKYQYQISESQESAQDYTTSISVQSNQEAASNAAGTSISGLHTGERILNRSETVTYTNEMPDIVQTGIRTDFAPLAAGFILLSLLAGIALAFRVMRRKYRKLH